MAKESACFLSRRTIIGMAVLLCMTELHRTTAYVRDSSSSSNLPTRRHHPPNDGDYSRNLSHHINHHGRAGRTSRSNYNNSGGATSNSNSNDLVRIGANYKPTDRYGTSKTQYKYEHVQTGSVMLPKGGRTFLEPDQNRTLAYIAKLDTTVYRQKPHMHRNRQHRQRHPDWSTAATGRRFHDPSVKSTVVNGLCIKCPAEKTAIARKGLDGVLIEPPMLTTCRNQPISRDLYELETLFGTKLNFILPHSNGGGPFSFLAKIVNKRSGKVVQTCDLRYKVIVKQCGKYYPKNKDLKVACDLGNIWGSRCNFHCRNGGYLSRQNAFVECSEEQTWQGEEPHCMYNEVSNDYAYDSDAPPTSDCTYLIPPNNGRFACEMNPSAVSSNDLYVPNGTVCRIKCNEHFEIPVQLQAASVFHCEEGRWNSTMKHFCHKPGAVGMHRKRSYG